MAISAGNWASSTDPFIEASGVSFSASVGELSSNRIRLDVAYGFFLGLVDKDLQELFWSNDLDRNKTWAVSATYRTGSRLLGGEFGGLDYYDGSAFVAFEPRGVRPADPGTVYIYVTGKSAGSVLYSLYAYIALTWVAKDPAQIIFSWCSFYVASELYSGFKAFLNQASFQAASDFYDDIGIDLVVWRETGISIAEQIKRLMAHTADFLSIRPDDSDGAVELFIHTRRNLTERTTAIDLESKSVASYAIRPSDQYTLDQIETEYGPVVYYAGLPLADTSDHYLLTFPPADLPTTNRTVHVQKFGDINEKRGVQVDCKYAMTRHNIMKHIDLSFWHVDQDEIEIEFADWSHLNFDVGDLVHVTGRGFDGTENLLVVSKTIDLDSLLASCEIIEIRGVAGKHPAQASGTQILSFSPNSLGYFEDGDVATTALPLIPLQDAPRNNDRWWDESGRYASARVMDRGTAGPSGGNPEAPKLDRAARNRIPALFWANGQQGLMLDYDASNNFSGAMYTSGAANLTAYFVVDVGDLLTSGRYLLHQSGSSTIVFASHGGGTPGTVQYYDGSWHGSQITITGWQILTFVLDSAGASIRRNGAVIESGLSYTPVTLATTDDCTIGIGSGGNGAGFFGSIAEIQVFEGVHDATNLAAVEAHLAEKYGITI